MYNAFQLLARSFALAAALTLSAAAATPNLHDAEKTIIDNERQWCDSLASGDSAAPKRFIADDFVGVPPMARVTRKRSNRRIARFCQAIPIEPARSDQGPLLRRYGGPEGDEVWELRTGEHRHGRYVWTDVWVLRNGLWQIVAAEDVKVLDPRQ